MPLLRRATRAYVAGDELDDALRIASSAVEHGYGVTICYWQGADETPESVASHYKNTIRRLAAEQIDSRLAVKVPALWERYDLIGEVLAAAREKNIAVDFDSHTVDRADENFKAAQTFGSEQLGCVIPGRWRRSLEDADRAVDLGLRVRVVKGSFADPENPIIDQREGYLKIIDRLAGRCRKVGVATHDRQLAREAFQRLKAAGTPCVQELLFGLPIEPAAQEGRAAGVPTRIYIPYGAAWFPYSISKALHNPRTLMWLARDFIRPRALKVPPPKT